MTTSARADRIVHHDIEPEELQGPRLGRTVADWYQRMRPPFWGGVRLAADSARISPVLLVEPDDRAAAKIATSLQMIMDDALDRVATLAEAQAALAAGRYEVALVEPALPDVQATDTVARLRSVSPEVAIVVASEVADDVAVQVLSQGAQEVLSKRGLKPEVLHQALLRAVLRGRASQELSYRATHDQLTGLFNAASLRTWLSAAVSRKGPDARLCALLYIDLDEFKPVNDRFGHEAGDEVLRIVANRIQSTMRSGDQAARMGGDEFALVLRGLENAEYARGAAQRVLRALSDPIQLGVGPAVRVSASVGIAVGPREGESSATLLRRADQAMFAAKAHGRACCGLAS